MDGLLPIGEFSERSGLSPKRLRTYAAEGLLVPAAVDPASGYRYYSPGQVREAEIIGTLRQAGMPLGEIRQILIRSSPAQLDAWAVHLESEAAHRRRALHRASHLLAVECSSFPARGNQDPKEAAMTHLKTAARTETGRVRNTNEDAVTTTDRVAVVADGMGGHPGGEIAAGMAAGLVPAAFTGRSLDELEAGVRAANWAIWDRSAARAELEGMGTTICAIGLLDDGHLGVANVGDSRAYLWHRGAIMQLTVDHSVTAELVGRGELEEERARHHPHYGVLTRALGMGPDVEVDAATHVVVPGDRVLVCSDGLFNEVTGDEMAAVLSGAESLEAAAAQLLALVVSREARDNISVVVAEVAADG